MNKARALFFLKRRWTELTLLSEAPSQTTMAAAGMDYEARNRLVERCAKEAEKHRPEIEALAEVIALVEAQP